jgi:hypothetical protein
VPEQTTEVPEATRGEAFEAALDRIRRENAAGKSLGIIEVISLTLDATFTITIAPLREELEEAKQAKANVWKYAERVERRARAAEYVMREGLGFGPERDFKEAFAEIEARADSAERRLEESQKLVVALEERWGLRRREADDLRRRLEDEKRLRRAFAKQRDEAHAKLAKVTRALGPEGAAADVGAARLALATLQDSQVDGEGEKPERKIAGDDLRSRLLEEIGKARQGVVSGTGWTGDLIGSLQDPDHAKADLAERRMVHGVTVVPLADVEAAIDAVLPRHPESTEGGERS